MIYNNITTVYNYVRNELRFDTKDIFFYGNSVGSGPSVYMSAKLKGDLGGLILQAPFLSCVRTVIDVRLY